MTNKYISLLIGLAAALTGTPVKSSALDAIATRLENGYNSMNWRVEDGLPFGEVRDILQTRDGHLWLATLNGAARFDGIRFQTFDLQNAPELADPFIRCLYEDRQHRLWLGHISGHISVREGNRFRSIELPAQWPRKEVVCFLEDEGGDIWAVSLRGEAIKVSSPTPEQLFIPPLENRPGSIHKNGIRVVMQSTDSQIMEYRLDEMPILTVLDGDYLTPPPLAAFAGSQTNDYWMITHDNHLKRYREGDWIEDLGESTWLHKKQTLILEGCDGTLYVGTRTGIFIYDRQGAVYHLDEDNGLVHNQVLCLTEDREGTIWAGTGAGISAVRPPRFKSRYITEDLKTTPIMAITPKNGGGLWIGTYGKGLLTFDRDAFKPCIENPPFREVRTVMEASDGAVWINCLNRFLARYANGKMEEITATPRNGREMNVVFEMESGQLWSGGANGVFRQRPNAMWVQIPRPPALVGAVRTIEEGPRDILWFARESGGLLQFDAGTITRLGRADGLPNETVRTLLYEKERDILWIGTSGGLAMKSGYNIVSFTEKDGLPGNVVSLIVDDQTGRLWLQTNQGVAVVEKQQLYDFIKGSIGQLSPLLLDATDGFTLPGMGERIQTGCRTDDGSIWFVTTDGLLELDPAEVRQSTAPVPLWFSHIQVNDVDIPLENGPPPRLPAGVNRCNISYSALSFNGPHRIRFKYRLRGYDDQWTDVGTRRRAEYQRLPPGNYRLELLARNGDGFWNSEPATLAFVIPPFFWETAWFKSLLFIAGVVLSAGLGLAIADRLNRRRLIRAERLRAVEQERSRISMDIHDEIGAGLTRVTLLSGLIDRIAAKWTPPPALTQNLKEMERESGKLVRALDEIVWMIAPGNDTLQNLCAYLEKFAMDYLDKTEIRCKLDIPYEFPAWNMPGPIRHSLFLLVKEALNNIVKHAEATEVTLSISTENDLLTITLHDNGKGIDGRSDSRFSHGLKGMRKRMEQMGGTFTIQSDSALGTSLFLSLDKHNIHM